MRKIKHGYYADPKFAEDIGCANVLAKVRHGIMPGEIRKAIEKYLIKVLPDAKKSKAAMIAKMTVEGKPPVYLKDHYPAILNLVKNLKPLDK